ncbi:hypothetical protein [Acidovorax radicis]|jgi:hypothetical protein|uniref:hypothetical protein n=1 Tax=Acidovorax radicis TaxID=758826 RepID=UPI001CF8E83F|nr:hypothetical protein [Acidovorax radicis]UCU99318.1 hypothetical protein KI609_00415 [Acidovorax radicis]
MKMRAFWRTPAPAQQPGSPKTPDVPPARRRDPAWIEVPLTVLSWFLPGSAVVVAAIGQFALALVLLAVAAGVWLRLWRGRKRWRNRTNTS